MEKKIQGCNPQIYSDEVKLMNMYKISYVRLNLKHRFRTY